MNLSFAPLRNTRIDLHNRDSILKKNHKSEITFQKNCEIIDLFTVWRRKSLPSPFKYATNFSFSPIYSSLVGGGGGLGQSKHSLLHFMFLIDKTIGKTSGDLKFK